MFPAFSICFGKAGEATKSAPEPAGHDLSNVLVNILRVSLQPSFISFPNGRIIDCNQALCDLAGYAREELCALPWDQVCTAVDYHRLNPTLFEEPAPRDTLSPEAPVVDRATTDRSSAEAACVGEPLRLRRLLVRRDGARVPVSVALFRAGGDEHRALYFSFVSEAAGLDTAPDGDAPRESEGRFQSIFSNASVGIMLTDEVGRAMVVNNAYCRFLGYSREEILGTHFSKMTHPEDLNLSRHLHKDLVNGRINSYMIEKRYIRQDGAVVWGRLYISLLKECGNGQNDKIVVVCEDISELKRAESRLQYLSFHDELTGLYNRSFFEDELKRLDATGRLPLSLIMCDINGLKLVNDAFGHRTGDELLAKTARILKKTCRSGDVICRWGGDEFTILLPGTRLEAAEEICNRIRRACLEVGDDPIPLSIALGVYVKDGAGQSAEEVLREAEDRMYRNKLLESKSVHNSIIASLQKTLTEKTHETGEHGQRMLKLVLLMADRLELSSGDRDEAAVLAALHDIGKIAIPDRILTKPRRLTKDEWQVIKRHPEIGYRIALSASDLARIAGAVLSHHECWDGSGYPQGLQGNQIPLISRILAIADTYDVMTTGRPYRKAVSHQSALDELRRCAGTIYDPLLVDVFLDVMSGMADPGEGH